MRRFLRWFSGLDDGLQFGIYAALFWAAAFFLCLNKG